MSLPKERRLRKSADFAAVRRCGKARSDGRLVAVVRRRADSGGTRFGFSVSKRIGGAVIRNKMRRRLKAAAAELKPEGGWDIVFIARQGARDAGFWQLRRSVRRLVRRAGVGDGARSESAT